MTVWTHILWAMTIFNLLLWIAYGLVTLRLRYWQRQLAYWTKRREAEARGKELDDG